MQRGKGAVRRRAAHVKEGDRMTRATEFVSTFCLRAVVSLCSVRVAAGWCHTDIIDKLLLPSCYRAFIYPLSIRLYFPRSAQGKPA